MAHLRRREFVIAHHEVDALRVARCGKFVELAAAEERGRIGLRALLDQPEGRAPACRARQTLKLLERLLGLVPAPLAGRQSNQGNAFVGFQSVTPGESDLFEAF
jgi:hypothetical protein